ncbi:MAG: hypothetical protein FJ265_18490 [Planctomycetes bacterium]|nr:hypothetical protein [Planctomycetota bacterium]
MRLLPAAWTPLLVLAAACTGTPSLPEGRGRGLVACDPTPPPGATTWARPESRVGDGWTLLRGGEVRMRLQVVEAGPDRIVVRDEQGHRLLRDPDLGNLGEWPPEGDAPLHRIDPADVRFHWPLWVGKKWQCEFADRTEQAAVTIRASYAVEGLDRITVPAGTFEALRVVRRARLVVEGEQYLVRTTCCWYAPAIGLEVRQLLDNTEFELVEWVRGPTPAPGD